MYSHTHNEVCMIWFLGGKIFLYLVKHCQYGKCVIHSLNKTFTSVQKNIVGRRFKDRRGVDTRDEEDRYKKGEPRCGLEALGHVCICAAARGGRGKPAGHGPEREALDVLSATCAPVS